MGGKRLALEVFKKSGVPRTALKGAEADAKEGDTNNVDQDDNILTAPAGVIAGTFPSTRALMDAEGVTVLATMLARLAFPKVLTGRPRAIASTASADICHRQFRQLLHRIDCRLNSKRTTKGINAGAPSNQQSSSSMGARKPERRLFWYIMLPRAKFII